MLGLQVNKPVFLVVKKIAILSGLQKKEIIMYKSFIGQQKLQHFWGATA